LVDVSALLVHYRETMLAADVITKWPAADLACAPVQDEREHDT
jgi:hypothetical protein